MGTRLYQAGFTIPHPFSSIQARKQVPSNYRPNQLSKASASQPDRASDSLSPCRQPLKASQFPRQDRWCEGRSWDPGCKTTGRISPAQRGEKLFPCLGLPGSVEPPLRSSPGLTGIEVGGTDHTPCFQRHRDLQTGGGHGGLPGRGEPEKPFASH